MQRIGYSALETLQSYKIKFEKENIEKEKSENACFKTLSSNLEIFFICFILLENVIVTMSFRYEVPQNVKANLNFAKAKGMKEIHALCHRDPSRCQDDIFIELESK